MPRPLWKKGQSGNPLGGQKHDPALKAIKRLTKDELVDIGNLVVKGNVDALRKVVTDPKSSVIRAMVASVAVKIISKGDMAALDVLLNRLIGKVKDEVHHTGDMNQTQVIVSLPSNGFEMKETVAVEIAKTEITDGK